MWKTNKWIFIVTTVPLMAVGIGLIVSGTMASPEALTDDGYNLKNFYYLVGGLFLIFPLLTTLGVMMFYKRINDRETFLIQNDIQGEAERLHQEHTGTYINELPRLNSDSLLTCF